MYIKIWICIKFKDLILYWYFTNRKSMVPLLFVSNVLKMFWLKFSALPLEIVCIKKSNRVFSNLGKIFEYMAMNFSLLSSPLGQSFRKPSYHSCNWQMMPKFCSEWSLSSFLSCRCQRTWGSWGFLPLLHEMIQKSQMVKMIDPFGPL